MYPVLCVLSIFLLFLSCDMISQTEATIYSIRSEKVTQTKSYWYKINPQIDSTCCYCHHGNEMANHLVSGSPVFNFYRYIHRHDRIARAIYWSIRGAIGADRTKVWRKQQCPSYERHAGHLSIWYQSLTRADKKVTNRPDITIYIIEVSVPKDFRAAIVADEKREKYICLH